MIRIVIADDHNLVRAGIRTLIEKADDIEVVGEATNGREAVALAKDLHPDVLLMDINMPQLNGVQATSKIQELELNTQVVILSMHAEESLVRQALQNGAKSYVLKGAIIEDLLMAIRAANRGASYLSPLVSDSVLPEIVSMSSETEETPRPKLTTREHEVLQLVGQGHTNNDIAKMMYISVKTVERHRANLMSKLQARNLVELIRIAIKHELIELDM